MASAVSVRSLRKEFRTKQKLPGLGAAFRSLVHPSIRTITAVDGVSFEVERGEILAFIGPNGAGKSTTIKLLTGILYPDSGEVRVLGLDPHRERRALAYRIGTVFGQKSQLWFHLPPSDSFSLLAGIYDIDRERAKRRIEFLTEVFGIGDLLTTPVRKLSLGQRIRCEIAASLLHEPEILFLDEPTIGLDVVVKERIRDLIRTVNREDGVTVFLTSHDAGDIEKICRRVMVVNHGRIVWNGSVNEMKYTLLNRRIVSLKLEAPLVFSMEGVEIVKSKGYAAKLEVDLTRVTIESVVSTLLRENKIVDISIAAPPLEEIIASIYGRTEAPVDGEQTTDGDE